MQNIFGWIIAGLGAVVVIFLATGVGIVAFSRFRYRIRNPVVRDAVVFRLWRFVPVFLFLTISTVKLVRDLLTNTGRDPSWFLMLYGFLCGMMVWSSVETYLSILKQQSEKKSREEAIRRDMA